MKLLIYTGLIAAGSTLAAATLSAQAITSFTAGDLIVERVGDGTTAPTSAAAPVFLDEYTVAGVYVGYYALPTAVAGSVVPLVDSSAGSDGVLSTSSDGRYLVVPGYDATPGTAGITAATSAVVPREVATVSSAGTLVQTTINNYGGNNFRAAASPDGQTIYTAGATAGILTVVSGSSSAAGTPISTASTNNTSVAIYNGQLYAASAKGSTSGFSLGTIGTGLPTAAGAAPTGQPATELPGTTAGTTIVAPTAFVATTLTLNGTVVDTFYVGDSGKINKFTLNTTTNTYAANGSVTLAGVFGLTGLTAGTTETLYATTTTGLYAITDTGGTGAFTSTLGAVSIATVAGNALDRGVTFAPVPVPEPGTGALTFAGLAGLTVFVCRKRKAKA